MIKPGSEFFEKPVLAGFWRKIKHKNPKVRIYPVFRRKKVYSKPKIRVFGFIKNTDPTPNSNPRACLVNFTAYQMFRVFRLQMFAGFPLGSVTIHPKSSSHLKPSAMPTFHHVHNLRAQPSRKTSSSRRVINFRCVVSERAVIRYG